MHLLQIVQIFCEVSFVDNYKQIALMPTIVLRKDIVLHIKYKE